MGGHSGWKKRVATGDLAKGRGGAICRHRPHFGRKGEDLKLNRKGNIAGGNPKKLKSRKAPDEMRDGSVSEPQSKFAVLKLVMYVAMMTILAVSIPGLFLWLSSS